MHTEEAKREAQATTMKIFMYHGWPLDAGEVYSYAETLMDCACEHSDHCAHCQRRLHQEAQLDEAFREAQI